MGDVAISPECHCPCLTVVVSGAQHIAKGLVGEGREGILERKASS